MASNLRDVFLNPSNDWGNTINIHDGPTYYFEKHHLMSGKGWGETYHKQRFKVLYIEKGLGKLVLDSKMRGNKESIDLSDGVSVTILPLDKYSIECYQDLTIFETGTMKKVNDTFLATKNGELVL